MSAKKFLEDDRIMRDLRVSRNNQTEVHETAEEDFVVFEYVAYVFGSHRLMTYVLSSSESHLLSSGKSGRTKKKAALTTQVRMPSRMKICEIQSAVI
jgi:hypothetical protein